jgi:molybdopterin-guanine dinucleotide biosynthesis protein A
MSRDLAVVILAGGEATRLPGKLELDAGGIPLILRVYRNVAPIGPVYLSANRSFPPAIEERLQCPIVIDRWPRRGPLGGLLTTFSVVNESRIFVVAGDAPFVDGRTAAELEASWDGQSEAVVPVNAQGFLEPLCAIYDRAAFLKAGTDVLAEGSGGVASVAERLKTKRVRLCDERAFANVNTETDRRSLL